MQSKRFTILYFIALCLCIACKRQDEKKSDYKLQFVHAPSAITSKEDPQARLQYEISRLVDPATGTIPVNIRQKEIQFSAQLPSRKIINQNSKARSTAQFEETNWQKRGPYNLGGRTRALALDATDESIILAGGVSGGMWRSTDNGLSWQKTTSPESIQSSTCITQDVRPGKTGIWYYGTGELQGNSARGGEAPFRGDGIFKSTDGGLSWDKLKSTAQADNNGFTSPFQYIWNIVTNPFNSQHDEVLAAAFGGILRSIDGGQTWTTTLGADLINETSNLNAVEVPFYTDVAVTSNGHYYATLSEEGPLNIESQIKGIFFSEDGENWIDITPPSWPQFYARTVIGISHSQPATVYFLSEADPVRLMRFTYQGQVAGGIQGAWADLSEDIEDFGENVGDFNTQTSYNMVLGVHPANPNLLFIGATNLYRYQVNGDFEWVGGYDMENDGSIYPNHYVDQHAIVFYPSNPNKMLTGNDGGVQVTNNNLQESLSFTSLNNGYLTSQFYTIALDRSRINNLIIGGMQDNGSHIVTSAGIKDNWDKVIGGDGGYCAVSRDGLFYYMAFQNGQIYRLTFDQQSRITSFARVDPLRVGTDAAIEFIFVTPYVLDPANGNLMYLAGSDMIWRNNNLAQIPSGSQEPTMVNWDKLPNTHIDTGILSAVNISTQPADVLYYGTSNGRVFKLEDAKKDNPLPLEITSSAFAANAYVSNIAIDPANADNLMVIFSNYNVISIFYSDNGGLSFTNISGNLEENADGSGNGPSVRWGQIIPLQNGEKIFVVATSTGVYTTNQVEDSNTTWARESPELMGNVVVSMLDYRSLDGQIIAATHGNGVFSKKFANVKVVEPTGNQDNFEVTAVYPNPFTHKVTLQFSVPSTGLVKANIYNTRGQLVNNLFYQYLYAGENEISWDGTDESGTKMANGTYIVSLEFNGIRISRQLVLNNAG